MTRQTGLLAHAFRRVRKPVLIPLLGGNALLLVCGVLGLAIPDSHAWQVLLSLLLALGLLWGMLLWNALALRRLRVGTPSVRLWQGALLLGAFLLLAAVAWFCAGLATPGIEARAGYWNSQLSAGLRHTLTYARLITLQQFVIAAVQWVLISAVLLPFAMESVTFGLRKPTLSRGLRVLITAPHWAVSIVALGLNRTIVPALSVWHPAHSVSGETVSALLRLGFAGALTVMLITLLLCVDAELLSREQADRHSQIDQHGAS